MSECLTFRAQKQIQNVSTVPLHHLHIRLLKSPNIELFDLKAIEHLHFPPRLYRAISAALLRLSKTVLWLFHLYCYPSFNISACVTLSFRMC